VRRVALLLPNLAGGGAERVVIDLAAGLRDHCDVDLVVGNDEGPLRATLPEGVRLVDLGASRVLSALPALRRYLRQQRPDVLMSAITHANVVATIAARTVRPRVPVVVTHHNTLSSVVANTQVRRDRWGPMFIRLMYPRADRIVAVSNGVADDLARTAGLSRERIDVIYNPVLFDKLLAVAEQPTGHPWLDDKQGPVLLGIGRLHEQKDFANLLRALALLPSSVRVVVVGEGPLRPDLERLAGALGVADRVQFPGFVDNPYSYLRTADVFVLSSQWEGLPTALIEALPFDTSIVSTDCPSGPREILADGKWGALVPPGDPEALATAITNALGTRTPRPPAAWERYRLDVATQAYLELFTGLAAS
jgi:glycosyltransferase involved in cell wall biosynthesis